MRLRAEVLRIDPLLAVPLRSVGLWRISLSGERDARARRYRRAAALRLRSGSRAACLTRAALRTGGTGAAALVRGADAGGAAGGVFLCVDLSAFASSAATGAVASGLATAGGALSAAATEGAVFLGSWSQLGSVGTAALTPFSWGRSGSAAACVDGASVFTASSLDAECGTTGDVVVAAGAVPGLASAWSADIGWSGHLQRRPPHDSRHCVRRLRDFRRAPKSYNGVIELIPFGVIGEDQIARGWRPHLGAAATTAHSRAGQGRPIPRARSAQPIKGIEIIGRYRVSRLGPTSGRLVSDAGIFGLVRVEPHTQNGLRRVCLSPKRTKPTFLGLPVPA